MELLTYLKLRTCLSASLITVKEGERTPMTSIYVIASLIFLFTVPFMAFIIAILQHVKNINVAIHLPLLDNCCASQKRGKEDPVDDWMAYVGNHDNFLM